MKFLSAISLINTVTITFLWWLYAYSYTGWKVEDRPSSKIVFTFLKGKKIEEPLFNFDYDRVRDLTGTTWYVVYK